LGMGVGVGSPGRPGRDAAEDAGAAANFRRPALGDGRRTGDCRTVATGAQWRCDPPVATGPAGANPDPGVAVGRRTRERPGSGPANDRPAGAWPHTTRARAKRALVRLRGWRAGLRTGCRRPRNRRPAAAPTGAGTTGAAARTPGV